MGSTVTIIYPKLGPVHYDLISVSEDRNTISVIRYDCEEIILKNHTQLYGKWWSRVAYDESHFVMLWGVFRLVDIDDNMRDAMYRDYKQLNTDKVMCNHITSNESFAYYQNLLDKIVLCLIARLNYSSQSDQSHHNGHFRAVFQLRKKINKIQRIIVSCENS